MTAPDASVSDVPVSDVPVSDVPVSDVPVSDVPVSDVSVSDVPVSDVSVSDGPPLRLGGADESIATDLAGHPVTYRQFAELIGRVDTGTALLDATGLEPLPALAVIFAAARAGRPVLVGDPTGPARSAKSLLAKTLPAGSFLVVVTSGSSGHPRLVSRTAASWTASFAPLAALAGLSAADRVLLTGPLSSTLHLFAAVHALSIGATLTDRPADATAVHAVPTMLESLLAELPADAPLRTAIAAGSAVPPRVEHHAAARGITLLEYYGAAELSFVAARRAPGPLQPFPGVRLRIDSNRVLWALSPYLAIGYVRAASDSEAVRLPGAADPLRRDSAGFATVGDLADWIEPGNPSAGLLIRGRGEAAITTGGHTVLAEDVESVLIALPGVAAVAAVGAPHERLGQLLTVVVELDAGETGAALRSATRMQLTGPAVPRRWLQIDRLPRTGGGKVARAAVLAGLADGTLATRPLP